MKVFCIALMAGLAAWSGLASAQSWQPLLHQPNFNASTALLLTDGTVICQAYRNSSWFRLTPDSFGSYVNGMWTQIASLPVGYGPLYYASAVLPDGRVVIQGGEYNISGSGFTNKGAIYDPQTDTWTPVPPPPGWSSIGDAQSIVLADGKFMLANPSTRQIALLDPVALTYTPLLGSNKVDRNDEEGWTLLPDRTVLTVDAISAPNSERYFPSLDMWMSAGSTIVRLEDSNSQEVGPAILRPDGTVFATGACQSSASGVCISPGHTAIYTPPADLFGMGTWTPGPDFPSGLDVADGPAALLPNGNVLIAASPGVYLNGTRFFEWDGTALNELPKVPNAPFEPAYAGRMLVLPTGQILYTDGSRDAEIYTSAGVADPSWAPVITDVPFLLNPGKTYPISGTQFNGLSQGAAYGDDAQSATNYPLVRITNRVTGHVFYCKTHDHSTMAVATGSTPVSTNFDVPYNAEPGIGDLAVVANGIPSPSRIVIVGPAPGFPDN